MAFFDFLTGTKRAPKGVARQDQAKLKAALLAINRSTAPFVVRDGGPEECDLVAEWRVVDAKWYEIFAKAGLTKVEQVLMKFDESAGEVRSVQRSLTVEWRAGVPSLSLTVEAFRGQKVEASFGMAYAFKENFAPGKVYEYRFRTKELKEPLQAAVAGCGWGWRGVAFGKL